jgi:hypothetical protein
MTTLLAQSKTFSSPFVAIPLLGVAVDVTTHLKGAENVNLTYVSGEMKVIDGCAYQVPSDGLSDRDHHLALELSVDGSDPCSLVHHGSMFTIKFPPLASAKTGLDMPHGVHQNSH